METPAQLLTPFQRKLLLKNLNTDLRPEYRRRIEIMLMADAGHCQTQICAELGCSQETARYWITKAKDGKAHQWDDSPMGRPKTISDEYLNRLKNLVSQSPREYGYPFERWTANWLGKHLAKEFGISVSDRHITRLLKQMGLSTRSRGVSVGEAAPKGLGESQGKQTATDLPETKNSGIAIHDLQPAASSDFLLPFNPIKTNP